MTLQVGIGPELSTSCGEPWRPLQQQQQQFQQLSVKTWEGGQTTGQITGGFLLALGTARADQHLYYP